MKSKTNSLLIVLGIYIISVIGGLLTCLYVKDKITSPVLVLLIGDIVCTIFVYISSLIFKNSSVYDPYWSVIPIFIIVGYIFIYEITFDLWLLAVFTPFLFWAIRLTMNWMIGFDNLLWQDWRYLNYKKRFPKIFQLINFGGIMLIPTLLVFAGTMPTYYLMTGKINKLFVILGGTIILLATILQLVADTQMKKYKKNPNKATKYIDEGVWRYSRHPNYFAEIMIWVGLFVSSIPNTKNLSFIGFSGMILLFVFISIPLMEKHLLSTRPEYKIYKESVPSWLIPFFRKKAKKI